MTRLGMLLSITGVVLLLSLPDSVNTLSAMSIDFGSEFIKIALVKPRVPMEIVLNEESRRKTPNVVWIKNKERLFADAALTSSVRDQKSGFKYLLNLIGKSMDNPLVLRYKEIFPHMELIADDNRNTVQFRKDGEIYDVETLVAMILSNARVIAEKFAGQPVKDTVIAVPAFFNQAERRAMISAAEIAGLNLLQLLNDHSAAGLSYGVFRRKEITQKAQILLIYDMGASKTTASVLEFRLQDDKKSSESNPVMTTIGYGYDRTLGGFEITLRLRDYLVREFRENVQTKTDITANGRAMAKLLKEAEDVKQILSANPEHFAQVEALHEDRDLKVKVTRTLLEMLMDDLVKRMTQPIIDALNMAEMKADHIDQVVLMGAGTRVPRVQAAIQEVFKGKEIGKFLNTDEAIALGAVYHAAYLSNGFKVKTFVVQDLQIFPIQVNFLSINENNGEPMKRIVHRSIFGYKTHYPTTKKILTFTSHKTDFSFDVNYGELKHLSMCQLSEFGSTNISKIALSGIEEAGKKELSVEGTTFKGVKVHFHMDGSGIVHVQDAEVLVEHQPKKEESAFAALAGKITGLFSVESKKDEFNPKLQPNTESESKEKEETDEKSTSTEQNKEQSQPSNTENKQEYTGDQKDETQKTDEKDAGNGTKINASRTALKDEHKEKPKTVKIPLIINESKLDMLELSGIRIESSKKKLKEFADAESAKKEREEAHNTLESLVYDVGYKLGEENFKIYSTDEERAAISDELKRVRIWLEDETNIETPSEDYKSNKESLVSLVKPITLRIKEVEERPKVIADLLSIFNHSEIFLGLAKNFTESGIFTEVEMQTLEKVLNETKAWWTEKNEVQSKLKPTDLPAYTSDDVRLKILNLDREVKYLLNKMKFTKPKIKANAMENTEFSNLTSNSEDEDIPSATSSATESDSGTATPTNEEPVLETDYHVENVTNEKTTKQSNIGDVPISGLTEEETSSKKSVVGRDDEL